MLCVPGHLNGLKVFSLVIFFQAMFPSKEIFQTNKTVYKFFYYFLTSKNSFDFLIKSRTFNQK